MSMLARVQAKPSLKPPRIVIHGKGGVGKTTFGASTRRPVVLPLEDGLGTLEIPVLPKPIAYSDVMQVLEELLKLDHEYGTLVIDTIDHFEPLVWAEVCQKHSEGRKKYESVEDFGYGKGYIYADPLWTEFFRGLDALRRERNMMIVVLCHNETKTVDDPHIGPYDRITPKLHKRANALLHEWADIVGYLDIEKSVTEKEGSKGRKVVTATTTGRRMLYLEDRGGFVAKNRYSLPAQIQIPEVEPFSALRNEIAKRLAPQTKES
jgi:hypothetical protein